MKLQLILIMMVLCMPMVLAEAAFTFQQEEAVNYRFRCFDVNNSYCSSGTLLTISIEDPTGDNIYDNSSMTYNPTFFNHTLPTDELGEYNAIISSPTINGTISEFEYTVTRTGSNLSTGESIIYIVFLAAIIFTFILSCWGAFAIPFKNKRSDDGLIVGVNDLKYIKIFLIVVCYALLLFIFGLSKRITEQYLFLNGAHTVFEWLYWIMWSFIWPTIIVALVLAIVLYLDSIKLKKALMRGVPTR